MDVKTKHVLITFIDRAYTRLNVPLIVTSIQGEVKVCLGWTILQQYPTQLIQGGHSISSGYSVDKGALHAVRRMEHHSNVTVHRHLPGKENAVVDREPRIVRDRSDWMLNPHPFVEIQRELGLMEIGLFVSWILVQLPQYCSVGDPTPWF